MVRLTPPFLPPPVAALIARLSSQVLLPIPKERVGGRRDRFRPRRLVVHHRSPDTRRHPCDPPLARPDVRPPRGRPGARARVGRKVHPVGLRPLLQVHGRRRIVGAACGASPCHPRRVPSEPLARPRQKRCTRNHPPGRKVYQRGALAIWEVDGAKDKVRVPLPPASADQALIAFLSSSAKICLCLESSSST
jgi:hypothetical protein